MSIRRFCFVAWKCLGVIPLSLFINPAAILGGESGINLQNQQLSEDSVRQRISILIHRITENSQIRLKDGSYAKPIPVLPCIDKLREVKGYDNRAVTYMDSFLQSHHGLLLHISLLIL